MKKKTKKRVIRCVAVVLCALMLLQIASNFIPSESTADSQPQIVYVDENTPVQVVETEKDVEENVEEDVLEGLDGPYEVLGVKTGDCIHIAVKENEFTYVNLLGIETEDIPDEVDAGEKNAGLKAYEHARSLIQGKQVYLKHVQEIVDRKLMETLVYLDDGTLLNEQMLKDGFARVASDVPEDMEETFEAAMQEAKESNAGLWNDDWKETE